MLPSKAVTIGAAATIVSLAVINGGGLASPQAAPRLLTGSLSSPLLAFSPDGHLLAYGAVPDLGIRVANLRQLGRDGTGPYGLALDAPGSTPRPIAWSPDGSKIAYSPLNKLVVADKTGRRRRELWTASDFVDFSWAPDGKRVVFLDNSSSGDSVYIAAVDGRGTRSLATGDSLEHPAWSPLADQIVFADLMDPLAPGLYAIHPDGSGRRRLGTGMSPSWSPDGKMLAFSVPEHGVSVSWADGSRQKHLFDQELDFGEVAAWSPDSRRLAVSTRGRVTLLDVAHGAKTTLGQGVSPVWSPDGRTIVFVSRGLCPEDGIIAVTSTTTARHWLVRPCQVRLGTPGPDRLVGTRTSRLPYPGSDSLIGLGGDDVLMGLDGGDLLSGGPGNDRLDGGAGLDKLRGGEGNDVLVGGLGLDFLEGGPGDDLLRAGDGGGTLNGGAGHDQIFGGAGDDYIEANDGEPDRITCGDGRDTVERDDHDVVAPDCEYVTS